MLIPATTLLSGDDLADRLQRGQVRHVITNAAGMAKIIDLPPSATAGLSLVSVSSAAGRTARRLGRLLALQAGQPCVQPA